jgi:hypothetical protein
MKVNKPFLVHWIQLQLLKNYSAFSTINLEGFGFVNVHCFVSKAPNIRLGLQQHGIKQKDKKC